MALVGNLVSSLRVKLKTESVTLDIAFALIVKIYGFALPNTSGKRAFGQAHLVPAVIWAETKGLATSPQIRPPVWEPIVPVRYKPLVPV
jgi:hypothetical protein